MASSGNNKSPVSLLIIFATALVVLAAITPLANATTLGTLTTLTVTGQVCCTPTGTCAVPPVNGLANAPIRLECNTLFGGLFGSSPVTISTTTTTATGTFSFTVTGGVFSPFANVLYLTCRARVTLPVGGCTVVTTGSYLSNPITVTAITIIPATVTATANTFSAVP